MTITNKGKNPIIVDDELIKTGDLAELKKESELIIGGESIIVTSYESAFLHSARDQCDYELQYDKKEESPPEFSLKDYLLSCYKYKKI